MDVYVYYKSNHRLVKWLKYVRLYIQEDTWFFPDVYYDSNNRVITIPVAIKQGYISIRRIKIPKEKEKAFVETRGVKFYDLKSGKWIKHTDINYEIDIK